VLIKITKCHTNNSAILLFYKGISMQQLTQNTTLVSVPKTLSSPKQLKETEVRAFMTQGECLAIKHENYVAQYVTKANEELYLLLGEILSFAEGILATKNVKPIIKEMRSALTYKHKIKTQKNSTDLNIIVRFITRTSRKNALIYSQVLAKAISLNIKSEELAEYIKSNGGINKVRENANAAITADQANKLANLQTYYANKLLDARATSSPYATFEIDKARTSELHDVARYGEYVYMVCKKDGLGKFTVIDAIAMDKDLEARILQRYFDYEQHALKGYVGCAGVEAYLLKKFEETILADNEQRAKLGAPLLDKFACIID
jgi:hypothetical protein